MKGSLDLEVMVGYDWTGLAGYANVWSLCQSGQTHNLKPALNFSCCVSEFGKAMKENMII